MIRLLIDNDGTIGFGEPPHVVRNPAVFALAALPCYKEVSIFTHGGAKGSTYNLLMDNQISLAQFKKFVYTGAINEWREAGKISKVYTTYDIAWGQGPGRYYEDMIAPVERALIEIKENLDRGRITQKQANARYAELKPRMEEMAQFERNGVAFLYNITNTPGNQALYETVPGLQKALEDFREFFINSRTNQEPLKKLTEQYNQQIVEQNEENALLKEQIIDLLSTMDPRHSKENAAAYLKSITNSTNGTLNIVRIGQYMGSYEEDLAPTINEISKKALGYKQIQLENPYSENQMLDDSLLNLAYMEEADQSLINGNLTTALITMLEDRKGKECTINHPKTHTLLTRPYLYNEAEILNELCTHSSAMQKECENAYEICQSLVSPYNHAQDKHFNDKCKSIVQNANVISKESNKHPVWLLALNDIHDLTVPQALKDKKNLDYLIGLLDKEPQNAPQLLHDLIDNLVKNGEREFSRQNFRDSFAYYKMAYLFLDTAFADEYTIDQFKDRVFEKMKDAYMNERLQSRDNHFDNSDIHQLNAQIESSGVEARLRMVQLYMDLHQNIHRFAYANQGMFGFRQSMFAKNHQNPMDNDTLFSKRIVDYLIKTMEIYPNAEKRCKTKLAELRTSLSAQKYKDCITMKLESYEQDKIAKASDIRENRAIFQ
ncbi:hypothetical protein [Legionella longbeachae]|uniref:Putative coiled-coil protein n=1 Tax=Legionella longbeachae serogroup 1 (strain NSW150) TaxID=661367 RepID=D3HJI0_LEGLN|nr:hypothetical protein [Legionella longbeachae]VEE03109.1 coiled-coil protein [Legionella oakridgensis]HBD7399227.1 hypothetical protein [Legionella pneumophila]ARB93990.1 hypothetical protein A6J40_18165 [Legionella longbeachae]ARM32872.1 hypothetical protein B0B39_04785 [Legionella longbeachae]EEZ94319.1 conserved hypothetical protein [Legionella longbeachae D-4968]